MEENNELINHSVCKDCEHLVSRVVLPMDYEEFGIDIKLLKEEIEEVEGISIGDEDIAIVHNTCIVLNMDIGHVVLECNRFKKLRDQTIFNTDPWKK